MDGFHRYKISQELGITDPPFIQYDGDSPYSFVWRENELRRHLTAGQKACIGEEMYPFIKIENQRLRRNMDSRIQANRGQEPLSSLVQTAKLAGTSDKSIKFVKRLKRDEPELFQKVKSGGYTLNDAKRNMKRTDHAKKVEAAQASPQKETFNGPFDLILSDPPWKYDFSSTRNRDIENQYDTATVDEIIKHCPNSADNSVLFLWATAPKLLEALAVMKAWGFEYRTHAIWDKEKIGCGHWFRGQHELLLVGVKGSPGCPIHSQRISSVLREERTEHSKKPECVYKWIEEAFPDRTKLEMYCRNPRKGWSVWGNEI